MSDDYNKGFVDGVKKAEEWERKEISDLQRKLDVARDALEWIYSFEQDADIRREYARKALEEMGK